MRIYSPVAAIRNKIINNWNPNKKRAEPVRVAYDDTRRPVWVYATTRDAVYMVGATADNHSSQLPTHDIYITAVRLMYELGVISGDDFGRHMKWLGSVSTRRNEANKATTVLENLSELGVQLKKTQFDKLSEYIRQGDEAYSEAQGRRSHLIDEK